MRDLYLGPGASEEDKAAIKAHRDLCGGNPGQTPEQVAHAAQVTFRLQYRSWPRRYDMTCPACGIRWVQ